MGGKATPKLEAAEKRETGERNFPSSLLSPSKKEEEEEEEEEEEKEEKDKKNPSPDFAPPPSRR